MPANHRTRPKEERRGDIVAAACELFQADGYERASLNRIAASAGVTPNSVYWYFTNKDQLFVAALETLFGTAVQRYAIESMAERPLAEQLHWIVDQLRPQRELMQTVHARVGESDEIAKWHSRFHHILDGTLATSAHRRPGKALQDELRLLGFALEGIIAHETSQAETKRLCRILADQVSAPNT